MTSAATVLINPGLLHCAGFPDSFLWNCNANSGNYFSNCFYKGFAKYGSKVKATTMAQWMGNRYNSNLKFSSVLLLCY
jgi:sodium/pantothenate symporter